MEEQKKSSVGEEKKAATTGEVGNYFAHFDFSSLKQDLETLLKNGVHFGHQKARRHPSMDGFIYGTRKGVNIINLEKTIEQLKETLEFVKQLRQSGKKILFVGTKKQAHDLIVSAARHTQMPFVVDRWLGGTFTNYKNIKGRTKYLKDGQDMMEKGEYQKYTKFERMKKMEELDKLEGKMGGIKYMDEFPGAVFVVDVKEDNLAIQEAKHVGIPVIAITDTNVDIKDIDYPIPGNDDAISSVRVILAYLCKAILEQTEAANKEEAK